VTYAINYFYELLSFFILLSFLTRWLLYRPRILLMLELCMSGQALNIFLRSALAHTMNAFIGRLMCCRQASSHVPVTLPLFTGSSTRLATGNWTSGDEIPCGTVSAHTIEHCNRDAYRALKTVNSNRHEGSGSLTGSRLGTGLTLGRASSHKTHTLQKLPNVGRDYSTETRTLFRWWWLWWWWQWWRWWRWYSLKLLLCKFAFI